MKQKTIATRHLRTKIAAGYVLILFVICFSRQNRLSLYFTPCHTGSVHSSSQNCTSISSSRSNSSTIPFQLSVTFL